MDRWGHPLPAQRCWVSHGLPLSQRWCDLYLKWKQDIHKNTRKWVTGFMTFIYNLSLLQQIESLLTETTGSTLKINWEDYVLTEEQWQVKVWQWLAFDLLLETHGSTKSNTASCLTAPQSLFYTHFTAVITTLSQQVLQSVWKLCWL